MPLKAQLTANAIIGVSFAFTEPGFKVPIDKDLHWSISEGGDLMLHPVYIHGCQFRVIKFNGKAPPAYMRGWKGTVPISDGGAQKYMYVSHWSRCQICPTWSTAMYWSKKIRL